MEAKQKGWIRFIGITNHSAERARAAILSGYYDTLQFPFSSLADPQDIALAQLAKELDVGFIAMKGLAGGLITDASTTFAFIKQYPHVVPIWGIQREAELDEFLRLEENPPEYDAAMKAKIEEDRKACLLYTSKQRISCIRHRFLCEASAIMGPATDSGTCCQYKSQRDERRMQV